MRKRKRNYLYLIKKGFKTVSNS